MTVSRDAVIYGFKLFLGREPNEAAILAHMKIKDDKALAETLMKSAEFSITKRFSHIIDVHNRPQDNFSHISRVVTSSLKVMVLGNCQSRGLATLFKAMTGNITSSYLEINQKRVNDFVSGKTDITELLSEQDLIFVQPNAALIELIKQRVPTAKDKLRIIPTINYSAFHPDLVYIFNGDLGTVHGPLGEYQSSIAFYGWYNGLDETETISLFSEDVYHALGFFDYTRSSKEFLINMKAVTGIPLEQLIVKWENQGCWMHSTNHPKLFVLADIARALLENEKIKVIPNVEQFLEDNLMKGPVWPVYSEIASKLGVEGNYFFKRSIRSEEHPVLMLDLKSFIHESFIAFSKLDKTNLVCERLQSQKYLALGEFLKNRKAPIHTKDINPPIGIKLRGLFDGVLKNLEKVLSTKVTPISLKETISNPYQNLADFQFWRRSIERVSMHDVDPVVRSGFKLNKSDKVATAGSCFAQHISRTLQKQGFNYYIAEMGDTNLSPEAALQKNYGVFSARFGNLYSARQLVQLFDRAYGTYSPNDEYWIREDGKYVDPFRPQVELEGFNTVEDLENDRAKHFFAVREMFENLDVFVFTLGLTEAWRNRNDGAVFPLAPGVVAGEMNPNIYEFVNFNVTDVVTDMQAFIKRLLQVNPQAKMLVTVSPVPLIATYEDRHVLVSTTYSKSVLRAAAEEISKHNTMCEYFPSYEIITGNYTKGEYFESDLRSVKPEGVEHVMRLFLKHYSSDISTTPHPTPSAPSTLDSELMNENARVNEIICDEEALDSGRCG